MTAPDCADKKDPAESARLTATVVQRPIVRLQWISQNRRIAVQAATFALTLATSFNRCAFCTKSRDVGQIQARSVTLVR